MKQDEESIYQKLGVDPSKKNVKKAFSGIIHNEFPNAFVNIISDPYNNSRVVTTHLDGDGSKFVQRLLHFRETGDESVFAGMVDDAMSMNTGDIAASGFVFGSMMVSDVLNCGPLKELKEVIMAAVAKRFNDLLILYDAYGFNIKFLGGETADLPDQVRSCVFDVSVTAWAERLDVVTGDVEDGDVIIGLHSDGQSIFEEVPNSGLMSNGLTMARSCLMKANYNKVYPELKREDDFYKGSFSVESKPEILKGMSVGEALLSPTRQWAIVIREIIADLVDNDLFHMLHGITMNTGGGATKISNIGSRVVYKKRMPEPPPIFMLIQQESGEQWKNMYQSFNCGIGLDIVGENNSAFIDTIKQSVKSCKVKMSLLGNAYKMIDPLDTIFNKEEPVENIVILSTPYGKFEY